MKPSMQGCIPVRLTLRFYPGQDGDLLHWLDELEKDRCGGKNQAVKDRLRMGLDTETSPAVTAASTLDRPFELTALLAEVRKVVEAAVGSALGRFVSVQQMGGTAAGATATSAADDDDEVEGLLEALDQALVLGEEDL